jgi:hypothetical protein
MQKVSPSRLAALHFNHQFSRSSRYAFAAAEFQCVTDAEACFAGRFDSAEITFSLEYAGYLPPDVEQPQAKTIPPRMQTIGTKAPLKGLDKAGPIFAENFATGSPKRQSTDRVVRDSED